jgi:hypothetical protein
LFIVLSFNYANKTKKPERKEMRSGRKQIRGATRFEAKASFIGIRIQYLAV